MMATVLLIVTIPTEIEELRKRQEQQFRKTDADISIGNSSHQSDGNETNQGGDKPHIHEAVKKAMFILNTSQQKIQSCVYPKASEIFETKQDNVVIEVEEEAEQVEQKSSPKDPEFDVLETLTNALELNARDQTIFNESSSRTTSRERIGESFSPSNVKKKSSTSTIEGDIYVCLETIMRIILKELGISNAFWTQTTDGRMYQILFTISFDEAYEELLCELHERGIGERAGSTIVVLNCIASKRPVLESNDASRHEDPVENVDDPSAFSQEYLSRNRSGNRSQTRYRKGVWERFMNSVRSRLNIAQIIRCVRQDATIDFDFMILLISAALLSAFGLIDDSLVFLASSMLISPLMGPIIAAIFGTVIKDNSLRNMGIRNECLGISVSIAVGFFFGIFVCVFNPRFQTMEDITNEMMYRGTLHTLLMCSIAAIPSGAAVAIGILNGNMGSLIGVAISASLLPPAVNSGMLWAMAIFCLTGEIEQKGMGLRENLYFDDAVWDFLTMSGVSMGITVLNILLVFVTGVVLLKAKEIVPGIGGNNREFWKRDIKIARNISQQNLSPNAAILEELSNLPSEERKAMGINPDMLRSMQIPEGSCQHTWSPGCLNYETRNSLQSGYATVHRLDYLYSTITQQGLSEDFSSEYPTPSGRRSGLGGDRRNNLGYKYFMCNERERGRTGNSRPQQGPTHCSESSSDINMDIRLRRETRTGQVRRFFITPVQNSDDEPDEYDA